LNAERKFIGNWCWLLPLTYLAHVAEEFWGGFPAWMSSLSGAELTPARFLALNAVAWGVMAGGVALTVFTRSFRWLVIAFSTAICVNGAAHLLASLGTRTYSPGVITGTLLWLPLGVYALRSARIRVERHVLVGGIAAGVLFHAAVSLAALGKIPVF
jgi:hypothetical protein